MANTAGKMGVNEIKAAALVGSQQSEQEEPIASRMVPLAGEQYSQSLGKSVSKLKCVCLLQLAVLLFLSDAVPNELDIASKFFSAVPKLLYYASAAAFTSSFFHNLLSLFYETTSLKKQLALMQCLIKGISLLTDLQLGLGQTSIVRDSSGAALVPIRYVQWGLTCPIIVWLCAWISDASLLRVITAVACSACTPGIGYVAALTPAPYKWIIWCTAMLTHSHVLISLDYFFKAAERECIDKEGKHGLQRIRYFTHATWNAFPILDLCRELHLIDRVNTEYFICIENYASKVIFSSTVMYANFQTIAQRRAIAKHAEEHLARIKMVADLQKAVEAKEEFMSVISHELRTPLNGIIGLSEAMLGPGSWQLGDIGGKYMKTIKNSATHLASLINDILDAAAASKGKLAIKMEKASLDKIITDVLDISAQLVKKNVVIEKKIDPATPSITADKKRLTQIFYNLIGNALKFTHKGSVTVDVRPDPQGRQVIIAITDTGCGIPLEQHDKIFDAFNQGDSSTTRKYGGTGLGLNIVSRLVDAHHGKIKVDSKVGKGSTFSVFLPVFQPDESLCPSAVESNRGSLDMSYTKGAQRIHMQADARLSHEHDRPKGGKTPEQEATDTDIAAVASLLVPARQQENKKGLSRIATMARTNAPEDPCSLSAGTASLGKLKLTHSEVHGSPLILSVDDEPTNHMVIAEMIKSHGYELHEELDAQEALHWIAAQAQLPDLILLDCMMPNMSGHEFCKELRKTVPDSLVPVIMLSAKNSEENIVQGLQQGCNDFCSKPVRRGELIARIGAHLRVKADATWVNSLVNGAMQDDAEAMSILKSILPEPIILRIQEGQRIIGDSHPHVVMLFSDIVGFSTMAITMSPVEVFLLLTNLYSAFDKLVDQFDVYKVETIGDGYLVAAGHDETEAKTKTGRPVERMLKMAEAMLDVVSRFRMPNNAVLRIRIGINCGPAFAGVIGSKCPRYCFLGDTVNTASRMESTSFPMCIQTSQAVVDDANLPDSFASLGDRPIKGKGIMSTYLFKAGEWTKARDSWLSAQRISGDQTPNVSIDARMQQSAVGGTISHNIEAKTSSKLAMLSLQEQLVQLQEKFKAEEFAHQADRDQMAVLSSQLGEAKNGMLGSAAGASEAAAKLQGQLQQALQSLQDEKILRTADRSTIAALQAQLGRAEEAAQSVVDHANLAASVPNVTLPIVHQGNVGTAISLMMPGSATSRFAQGNQPLVQSAGYSIPQLLQSIGLEGYTMMFESQNVRLEGLLTLTHEDLEEMGVRSLGHRKSIMQAFQAYLQMYLHSCDLAAQHQRTLMH